MAWTAIRWAELAAAAWPNGRGVTRDYAGGEGWRASVAELTEDAAFSHLPGRARIFTVLGGAVELTIDGAPVRAAALAPLRFDGGAVTTMRLLTGPTQAFNVIHDPALDIDVGEDAFFSPSPCGRGRRLIFMLGEGRVDDLLLGPRDAAHGSGPVRIEGHALVVTIG